ncbi:MAG: CRISPR-associated endonuclease Cas2 [Magnetospirillum sp.]|nr:CRISPR-associated endonuclease Cas2 [Magnetospirillum sp.]
MPKTQRTTTANPPLSGYRFMWLLVMFDLPVGTRTERHHATRFRQWLLDEGFEMSQFSIYMRCCASKEQAQRRITAIGKAKPPIGNVHILSVTDKQFEQMVVYRNNHKKHGPSVPDQLALF